MEGYRLLILRPRWGRSPKGERSLFSVTLPGSECSTDRYPCRLTPEGSQRIEFKSDGRARRQRSRRNSRPGAEGIMRR